MIWRAFFAACFAFLSGQAAGQSNFLSTADTDVIANFDPETIIAALPPIGAQGQVLTANNGRRVVGVQMPSGARFIMFPAVCNDAGTGCRGVSIQAGFDFPNQSASSVNNFNSQGGLPKVVFEGDRARMYYYMIADVGIFRANFNAHMAVMDGTIRRYLGYVQSQSGQPQQSVSVAVSLNPLPTTELLLDARQIHELTLDNLGPKAEAFINRAP